MRSITLTTDFGLADPYVAIMHGVILGRCPEARIVDVSHGVEPQNLIHGGLLAARAWRWFPLGSVHVVVVDPGVGSGRAILAARCAEHRFLVPDNGLLAIVLDGREPDAVHRVEREDLCLHPISATFHGRDVFAPVAAALASGLRVEDLGPVEPDWQRARLPAAVSDAEGLNGEVLYCDHFGNAVTNLPAAAIGNRALVQLGDLTVPVVASYSAVPAGSPLAIVGSEGWLEVSINGGSAAQGLTIGAGSPVRVTTGEPA